MSTPKAQIEVKLKPGQIIFHLKYDGEKNSHTYIACMHRIFVLYKNA
jgi:hypothetical protein